MNTKQCLKSLYDEGLQILNNMQDPTDPEFDVWRIKVVTQIARLFEEDSIEYRQIADIHFEELPKVSENTALNITKRRMNEGLHVLRALYELEVEA